MNCFVTLITVIATVTADNNQFDLHMDKLPQFIHQTSLVALIKSKARDDLSILSQTEKIVYQSCESNAKNVIELAKCVSKLIRIRSRHNTVIVDSETGLSHKNDSNPQKSIKMNTTKRLFVPTQSQIKIAKRAKIARLHAHYKKKELDKIRIKRKLNIPNQPRCKTPAAIAKLQKIVKYHSLLKECNEFMDNVTENNEKILNNQNIAVNYNNKLDHHIDVLDKLFSEISQLNFTNLNILSPNFFEILPDVANKKKILSPNLLSFHEEGILPLPKLIGMTVQNDCETMEWMEMTMNTFGVTKTIEKAMKELNDHMKHVEHELYPRVSELKEDNIKYERLQRKLTHKQKSELKQLGYTQMNDEQRIIMYKNKNADHLLDLEEMIHSIASINPKKLQNNRNKRDVTIGHLALLAPFAFAHKEWMTSIFGNNIISPFAFFSELGSPRILGTDILSPRTFISTVLQPNILVARILSPAAFRYRLLSPGVLTSFIMVPEAFVAHILSPTTLNARVLSPDAFTAQILSPSAGSAFIGSPSMMKLVVLSPSIFSASLFSGSTMTVQILSPGILGANISPLLGKP